jgi:hypothetical protein
MDIAGPVAVGGKGTRAGRTDVFAGLARGNEKQEDGTKRRASERAEEGRRGREAKRKKIKICRCRISPLEDLQLLLRTEVGMCGYWSLYRAWTSSRARDDR